MAGRDKFGQRIIELSAQLFIEGADIEVTEEMEIILYSYFVQVGFGLRDFIPTNYDTILLYQSSFVGRTGGDEIAGKTYLKDRISLSWYHFSESHLRANDGENLGFYHVGQAMVQTLLSGESSDEIFSGYFETCGKIVFLELIKNPYHPLVVQNKNAVRGASFVDFFPAILEWFFEKPETLRKELPNSYVHLCTLLNQDPLAIESNYAFDKEKYRKIKGIKPIPEKIIRSYAFRELNWLSSLPLVSMIILPVFYFYYVRPNMILSSQVITLVWIVVSLAIFFGLKKMVFERQIFKSQFWWFWFSLLGAAPILLFGAFFLGNQVVFNTKNEVHTVSDVLVVYGKRTVRGTGRSSTYLNHYNLSFTDNYLSDLLPAREFYPEDYPNCSFKEGTLVSYETGTSLWGYEVIVSKDAYDPLPIPEPTVE